MPERINPPPSSRAERPNPEDGKKTRISRRTFLALIAAGVGGAVAAGVPKQAIEWWEKHKAESLREDIEKERGVVKRDIQRGIEKQREISMYMDTYNKGVEKLNTLSRDSEEYKKLAAELRPFRREINATYVEKGIVSQAPMAEATPYAEALLKNESALLALATIRVLYREENDSGWGRAPTFHYLHNAAAAYLDLSAQSQDRIMEKCAALFAYADEHDIRVAQMDRESILYAMIDDEFDFSLTPSQIEATLTTRSPGWKEHPATHANKDSYAHYNDLSALDIFELNRLQAVLKNLQDPTFIADVFNARDLDLTMTDTELGGVIARPHTNSRLRMIPAKENGDNRSYVNPNEEAIEQFKSAAGYHFHATETKTPPKYHGPSAGDHAFFAPGVVFSSIDENTIRAHFYVSRMVRGEPKNEVVFLGDIKKPE